MKYKMTEDIELKEEALKRLTENTNKYGERYCPYMTIFTYYETNSKDYICPCKNFREKTKVGDKCQYGFLHKIEE